MSRIAAFGILAAACFASLPAFGQQQYTIQSLGSLVPYAINDSSEVVGIIATDTGYAGGYIWADGNATPITLPAPYNDPEPEVAINNAGQLAVLFSPLVSPPASMSLIWDPTKGFQSVDVPAGEQANFLSINNIGEVGGNMSPTSRETPGQAAVWLPSQGPTLLPSFGPPGTFTGVLALNDVGDAAGVAQDVGSQINSYAVVWRDGTVIDLNPEHQFSWTDGINNSCQVIGHYRDIDDLGPTPFVWDPVNGLSILPDDGGNGSPAAINQEGQIVGQVEPTYLESIAALWENGTLYDLNDVLPADSGWDLGYASGINDLGQIVGWGTFDGQPQGFLLTPIPEFTGVGLSIGFCLLVGRYRRGS